MRAHRATSLLCLGVLCQLAWSAQAVQPTPELQGPTLPPPAPQEADPAALPRLAPRPSAPMPGGQPDGPRVQVQRLSLQGCQAIACGVLVERLGPLPSEALGLAEIDALAQRVTDIYRRAGYPFAQVLVPPQRIADGTLQLRVLEGVLGRTSVVGSDPLAPGAQAFLDAGLPLGQPIREDQLERTMLLIDDQPGFKLRPVLRPGQDVGTSDLLAQVSRDSRVSGDVGLDNTGNRSTGVHRLKASLNINSPFVFGDRVAITALSTDADMWLGALSYERPLGAQGWRGQVGASRTSYVLGGAFSSLGARGTADAVSLKASYPLLRSQSGNVLAAVTVQHKDLQDRYDSVGLVRDKSSELVSYSAQFDHRDAWLGGGVTYGQLSFTQGVLHLDSATQDIDRSTARTGGGFGKFNLDVARIQRVTGAWSLYARVSAQWSQGNLDSSEKYGLGGFLGVRAYPMGEGTGDRGWLGQTELRYAMGEFTPFLLADAGQMAVNARPWDTASHNRRSLAGAGAGLRWGHAGWTVEAVLSARVRGHAAQAESPDRAVRAWLTVGHHFD